MLCSLKAFVHVPLGMCVAHFWRGHMRSLETACNQLSAFSFERDVKCHCCSISHIHPMTGRRMLCDHETMRECLCIWFGSVAEFEKIMRDRVSAVFKESFRRCALPYRWIVGSTVPRSWSYIFILFQTAYAEDYAGTAAMCFISLGGLLSLTPLLLWLEQLGIPPQTRAPLAHPSSPPLPGMPSPSPSHPRC